MGDPKKPRKKFEKPKKIWSSERLSADRKLKETYGLKNMREIWRSQSIIRKKRQTARKLQALALEERKHREEELLGSLVKMGILKDNAKLDDVLNLRTEDLMERRLQTIVLRKGFANTAKQARQFIVHGKIGVNGKKVGTPSYIVAASEEDAIRWFKEPMEIVRKQEEAKKEKKEEKKDLKKEFEETLEGAEESGDKESGEKTKETPKEEKQPKAAWEKETQKSQEEKQKQTKAKKEEPKKEESTEKKEEKGEEKAKEERKKEGKNEEKKEKEEKKKSE